MAHLSLSLLGPLQITLDGQPVSGFAYNKARALLAYLAVEVRRPHHRDALVGLLWPDLPDPAARTNLRQTLTNLRAAIGDASATPPFLHITRDTVQFNPGSDYELDVTAFTTLLTACETHVHRDLERCRACAARMEQAISRYRGDFLAEFALGESAPFEEWQLLQREHMHQRALDALVRLADYHERRGDDEPARRCAQRQIDLEPWREEAHQQLMRLLARGGQRSAALAQYATCRRILARDLDVAPAPETMALYEQIRDTPSSELRVLSSEVPAQGRETQNHALEPFTEFTFERSERFEGKLREGSKSKIQNSYNLPAQLTPLIGRETELADLGALLENPACRLITIVGPGGIGKTRLALAAAADQVDTISQGVAFVPLAALHSAEFIVSSIAAAVKVSLHRTQDPKAQLLTYLREQELLLVLDNAEHLPAGTGLMAQILMHAPKVTLLVTSRERLHVRGEWLVELQGLAVPQGDQLAGVETYTAVRLFVRCAQCVHASFVLSEQERAAVVRICRLVAGMPLAIELAAAWVRMLSCAEIAREIEHNLSFLTSSLHDLPARHHSMQAVFDHSWNLLTEEERRVFRRLSVFRAGFAREAAEQIAGASLPVLAALVDKSLLRWNGVGRYEPHELIRQYAHEQLLLAGEQDQLRLRHLQFFLQLAEEVEPRLYGSERQVWRQRLEAEHDNLRAALYWGLERRDWQAGDEEHDSVPNLRPPSRAIWEVGLRLTGALGRFWYLNMHWSEGRGWLAAALTRTETLEDPKVRAKLLAAAGMLAMAQGDYQRAGLLLEEGLALSRALEDKRGMAFALQELGGGADEQGDYKRAATFLAEGLALYRELQDPSGVAMLLYRAGSLAIDQGDYVRGIVLSEESLTIYRNLGDGMAITSVLNNLGQAATAQGDYGRAATLLEESLALLQELKGRQACAWPLGNLAVVAQAQRNYECAAALYGESLTLRWALRNTAGCAWCLEGLAEVAEALEQPARAARLWGTAEALRAAIGAAMSRADHARHERSVATVRAQLADATFAAAWDAGRAMPLEQAIAYALAEGE